MHHSLNGLGLNLFVSFLCLCAYARTNKNKLCSLHPATITMALNNACNDPVIYTQKNISSGWSNNTEPVFQIPVGLPGFERRGEGAMSKKSISAKPDLEHYPSYSSVTNIQ